MSSFISGTRRIHDLFNEKNVDRGSSGVIGTTSAISSSSGGTGVSTFCFAIRSWNCFWTLSSASSSKLGLSSHATKPRWFLLALLFRTSLRKISRAAAGFQMVISSYWGRHLVPRIGVRLFSIGGFARPAHCSRPSAATTIRKVHSPSCVPARVGLKSCNPAGRCLLSLQAAGLCNADRDIRHSLGRLVGSSLSDEDWRLASLGVASGGLGARSAAEHAPAAYVAGLAQSQELCARIWPGFDEYDIDGGLLRADTESSLTASMLPNANIYGSSDTPSQKSLSAKIEARVCQHLLDPSSKERHRLTRFVLNRGSCCRGLALCSP